MSHFKREYETVIDPDKEFVPKTTLGTDSFATVPVSRVVQNEVNISMLPPADVVVFGRHPFPYPEDGRKN